MCSQLMKKTTFKVQKKGNLYLKELYSKQLDTKEDLSAYQHLIYVNIPFPIFHFISTECCINYYIPTPEPASSLMVAS